MPRSGLLVPRPLHCGVLVLWLCFFLCGTTVNTSVIDDDLLLAEHELSALEDEVAIEIGKEEQTTKEIKFQLKSKGLAIEGGECDFRPFRGNNSYTPFPVEEHDNDPILIYNDHCNIFFEEFQYNHRKPDSGDDNGDSEDANDGDGDRDVTDVTPSCPIPCQITNNEELRDKADAVHFDLPSVVQLRRRIGVPERSHAEQLYIGTCFENPRYYAPLGDDDFLSLFNYTLGYTLSSPTHINLALGPFSWKNDEDTMGVDFTYSYSGGNCFKMAAPPSKVPTPITDRWMEDHPKLLEEQVHGYTPSSDGAGCTDTPPPERRLPRISWFGANCDPYRRAFVQELMDVTDVVDSYSACLHNVGDSTGPEHLLALCDKKLEQEAQLKAAGGESDGTTTAIDEEVRELQEWVDVHGSGAAAVNASSQDFAKHIFNVGKKVEVLKGYMFDLAAENGICAGYVTEKVYQSLAAGAIPIYRGTRDVLQIVPHPDSVILVSDYKDVKDLGRYLREVMESSELQAKHQRWRGRPETWSPAFREHYDMTLRNSKISAGCHLCMSVSEMKKRKKRCGVELRATPFPTCEHAQSASIIAYQRLVMGERVAEFKESVDTREKHRMHVARVKEQGQNKKYWPTCTTAASAARGHWLDEDTFVSSDDCIPRLIRSDKVLRRFLDGRLIYVLGDSQSLKVGTEFHERLSTSLGGAHRILKSDRCDTLEKFLKLNPLRSASSRVIGPGMGPVSYGLEHPGCTDSNSAGFMHTKYNRGAEFVLLPCEFAKDADLANELYPTTQEAIFRHYVPQNRPPDLIFLNNGLHDAIVADVDQYEVNVRWLFNLINSTTPAETHVVFWSSPMTLGEKGEPQTSRKMNRFYRRVEKVIDEMPPRFHFLETAYLGMGEIGRAKHRDNVHLEEYSMLLRLWLMQILEVLPPHK
eukprot:TRINITY_DN2967_c0_g2_i1.p1 TRINITY_DN2967_c0_g2~~TRINITY_DN2967_c0_g2_i1.p1  ORF type:complete len:923 (-),score=143.90 TRINITY_DN2967_c0_g2_i1:146-2914(-)